MRHSFVRGNSSRRFAHDHLLEQVATFTIQSGRDLRNDGTFDDFEEQLVAGGVTQLNSLEEDLD